jgi:hypothetical protein
MIVLITPANDRHHAITIARLYGTPRRPVAVRLGSDSWTYQASPTIGAGRPMAASETLALLGASRAIQR